MSSSAVLARPVHRPPGDPLLRARDERLESLKAVVGKLAHDFNNFLVPQFGYLTLLKEEIPANSSGAQYAASMEATGRKSESYIDSILLGMRPHRQFSPHEFSFDRLVEETLVQWVAAIPNDVAIDVAREIEPVPFVGDEKQWRNAFGHLLSNARFALATGGKLEVRLRKRILSSHDIERLGLGWDEVIQLDVQDNGFGMAPEIAARAFEPFFTTRTQIKAAGLGLTIVHSVAQFHGGQVELRTGEDAGTTVTLWLPLGGSAAHEKLASVGGSLWAAANPKKKVLLVEGDPLMKEVLRSWVLSCNLDLQMAESSAEALRLVQRAPHEWVLAITEARLNTETGTDVQIRVAPTIPHVPWIFLGGKNIPDSALPGGETLLMKKPFSMKAFTEVIRKFTP
ncbi:MAG TPA: ATP-binding protein [Verrucomicrobiae bacterium]|nr:ATP-binding protein [Verrucomicrobiae bacterium]